MSSFLTFLLFTTMMVLVFVMLGGLIMMARGQSAQSNRFMRWRVAIQGFAVILFIMLVVVLQKGGE